MDKIAHIFPFSIFSYIYPTNSRIHVTFGASSSLLFRHITGQRSGNRSECNWHTTTATKISQILVRTMPVKPHCARVTRPASFENTQKIPLSLKFRTRLMVRPGLARRLHHRLVIAKAKEIRTCGQTGYIIEDRCTS